MPMTQIAKSAILAGISVLPVNPCTKKPMGADGRSMGWARLQTTIMSEVEAVTVFSEETGIAFIGGKVSKNLECLDFDDPAAYPEWVALVEQTDCAELLRRLYIQKTPSGGKHVVYRCESEVKGNQKLALPEQGEARIETRGEGGYFLVWPSPGYMHEQGKWTELPVITADQRDTLVACAVALGIKPMTEHRTAPKSNVEIGMPGQEFDYKNSWAQVLEPEGYTFSHRDGLRTYWSRPGKSKRDGHSCSTIEDGPLWNFSSSIDGLNVNQGYSKFSFLACTKFRGDYVGAAKWLKTQGYGGQAKSNYTAPPTPQDAPARIKQRWVTMADIESKQVDWLWENYIPIGEVTMIVGDPGEGKSTVAQAIVTAVTTGAVLYGDQIKQGRAIFLSAEQSVNSITKPRFEAMGANLSYIMCPDEVSEDDEPIPFVLDKSGMAELREICLEARPQMVVIDTVTAYIEASRDFNSANQTREWMRRLGEIARTTPCAMVLIGHLNKNQNAHPLQRVMGSMDFVGASRSVLLVGKDPDEPDTRGFCQIKSNVGPFGDPRGFSLKDGVFKWTDGSTLDQTKMLQPPSIKAAETNIDKCRRWMRDLFKESNVIDPPRADDSGKIGGFTTYMVTKVKKELGVASTTDSMTESGYAWTIREDNQWWQK